MKLTPLLKKASNLIRLVLAMGLMLVSVGVSAATEARNSEVGQQCNVLLAERYKELGIDRGSKNQPQNLNSCVNELVELYDPMVILDQAENLEGFECGFICRSVGNFRLAFFGATASKQKYIEKVSEFVDEELQEKLNQSFDGGLEGVISQSIDEYQESLKSRGRRHYRKAPRNLKLQKILGDLVAAVFISEIEALGLKNNSVVSLDDKADFFRKAFQYCVEKVDSDSQLGFCASSISQFVALNMGQDILRHFLVTKFSPLISDKRDRKWLNDVALASYNQCMVQNTFIRDFAKVEAIKPVQSCIYFGMIQAFLRTAKSLLHVELVKLKQSSSQSSVDLMVKQSVKQCQSGELIIPDRVDQDYFIRLQQLSPQSLEGIVRKCQFQIEQNVVGDVAYNSIAEQSFLKSLIGEESKQLAQAVIDKHYSTCVDSMDQNMGRGPKDCAGYLMIKAVEELIEIHGENQFDNILFKMAGIKVDEKFKMHVMDRAKKSMKLCQGLISQKALLEPLSTEETEKQIVNCLNFGVSSLVADLAYKVFNEEISKNQTMKKYQIIVGPNKMTEILATFEQCFKSKMTGFAKIEQLVSAVGPSVSSCQIAPTQEVGLFVMNLVLIQELQAAGLTEQQVNTVVNNYKKSKNNMFDRLKVATTMEELEELSNSADYQIIKSISFDVISIIIENEAGEFLSKKEVIGFARNIEGQFVGCIATGSVEKCKEKLTRVAMAKVLRHVIPRESQKYFIEFSKDVLTRPQAERVNLGKTMKYWMIPGKTKLGDKLIAYIVNRMLAGDGLDDLIKQKSLRNMVYVIVTSSRRFMETLVTEIVQAELDKERQNPSSTMQKIFIRDYAYNWQEIRPLPQGQQIVDYFKRVLKKIIVEDGSLTKADEQHVINLVSEGVKKVNFSFGAANRARTKSRSSSKTREQRHSSRNKNRTLLDILRQK